jgi:exosortase/archaeosortase family protein
MGLRKTLLNSFKEKRTDFDFWVHCGLFALLVFALWPITVWFVGAAHDQSRLLHALAVLTLAIVALIRFGNIRIDNVLSLNPSAKRVLVASYGILLAQGVAIQFGPETWRGYFSLLAIPAYCCALAGLFRFIFGEGTRRLTRTAAGTLCAFLFFSILMQPLDWPLRGLAGKWSASALEWIGKTVELGLVAGQSGPPKLILLVDQHPFHVASECNGFGVILTSLLIALLLSIYRKLNLLDTALNLLAAFVVGFAFNITRIVIIVLLAPSLMEHYMLMHEIVGGISYWGCLLLLWVLLKGPTQDEAPVDQPQSQSESM